MAGWNLFPTGSRSKGRQAIEELRRSGLVDSKWYFAVYPDVAAAGTDPIVHYVLHGADEGRDPSAGFSTRAYLEAYPDVAGRDLNPLLHFVKLGAAQGRKAFPSKAAEPNRKLVDPDRDRTANTREAALCLDAVSRSAAALDAFRKVLPSADDYDGSEERVPKIIHFIYGFIRPEEFPYFAYLAVKSAIYHNPGWTVFFYYIHEPHGRYWDALRRLIKPIQVAEFEYLGNARLQHYAHKADAIRLLALQKSGGVYLDIDTITRKSYEPLRAFDFTMGVQAAGPDSASGLCNAVMIGCPNAPFLNEWIGHYDYFRSTGRDDLWDYHSVKLPGRLAATTPYAINILDYRAFFYPLWNTIEHFIFKDRSYYLKPEFDVAYCFHLWNGASDDFLISLSPEFIKTSKSIYAEIAREVEGIAK